MYTYLGEVHSKRGHTCQCLDLICYTFGKITRFSDTRLLELLWVNTFTKTRSPTSIKFITVKFITVKLPSLKWKIEKRETDRFQ